MGKSIDKIRSTFYVIWEKIESYILGSILFIIVFGAIALEANREKIQKNTYPKKVELGLGENVKSSLVKVGNHEYMVTTYTTKVGSGISTIHNQDCKCFGTRTKPRPVVNPIVDPRKNMK